MIQISKLTKAACILCLVVVFTFLSASLWWGCVYRLPRSKPIMVDLRSDKTRDNPATDRCFMICAGLANNPHGFPGHCYIIWDRYSPERLEYTTSDGFVPGRMVDLIPSLYSDIHGIMADNALIGNMRNFDYVAVRVDRPVYDRARAVRQRFVENSDFHTGVRDCVAYVDEISEIAGLKTPKREFVYPLDYLVKLKEMNK